VKSGNAGNTSILSRDHTIVVSHGGLVTITGGKWTTYRKMAKDAVDNAAFVARLESRPCRTDELRMHGWVATVDESDPLHHYGSDAAKIRDMIRLDPSLGEKLHEAFPYCWAEVVWAVEAEMAVKLEDVVARRTRMLFLDARVTLELAPAIARRMATILHHDETWVQAELTAFRETARHYLP
jgi:glycerol-3-phosphate dehydrogenase